MCACVCMSPNKPANNLADGPCRWAGCYHGNLTASIFLAHTLPLNSRPMTDQPTGKSGLLKVRAWVVCLHVHVYIQLCLCVCPRWAWYKSRELYNLLAPRRLVNRVLRWQLATAYRAWHFCSGQFYFQEDAAMCQRTGHIFQIEESSERSG